jgi:uncharacterized heparinase superfamily protein
MNWTQTLARNLAFARHIPPRRIGRRILLDAQRRVLQTPGGSPLPDAGDWAIAEHPPRPLFPARTGKLQRDGDGFAFLFLNRSRTFTVPVDWRRFAGQRTEQLWSMNLHYMEFLEAADDAAFAALVRDWLKSAKPYDTGYWRDVWNSYAVSLRVVVWMQQLAARHNLPDDLRDAMHTSLAGQVEFLSRNLETDLGGNHLIKNIKALIWASAFFGGTAADRWRRLGLSHLRTALAEQILPDGMHYERSPSYHAQVFADLLECRAALGAVDGVAGFDNALDRMAQVTADLTHPDGGPALFNDAGLTMCYGPAACLDVYATLMGRRPRPQTQFAYRNAGFFGYRHDRDLLIADCGPIGADSLPAHAHGDVLSFEWSVEGQRMIVDQGVFEYVAGPKRAASRASSHHNTLSVDGIDQADFFADFRVGRRPTVTLRQWSPSPSGCVIEGYHDGFSGAPGGPRHVRRFDATPDTLTITDTLVGTSHPGAAISFLLHPDVRVDTGQDATAVRLSRGRTHIVLKTSLPLTVQAAVWWPDMGVELPTQRLRMSCPAGCKNVTSAFSVSRT